MPILAELLDLYPADWSAISDRIRFVRAGGRCECAGECGRAENHLDVDGRCRNRHGMPRWGGSGGRQSVVVLSTAHLDHWPPNCADENLLALCEGCHLEHDRAHHQHTARERAYRDAGFVPLFEL